MEVLKPKKVKEDKYWTREYIKKCPSCKCIFSYTEKDVRSIFDYETQYVICPECKKEVRVSWCPFFRKKRKEGRK